MYVRINVSPVQTMREANNLYSRGKPIRLFLRALFLIYLIPFLSGFVLEPFIRLLPGFVHILNTDRLNISYINPYMHSISLSVPCVSV